MVVVEQDLLRSTISDSLRMHGLDVVLQCRTAVTAIQGAAAVRPEAALLDVSLNSGADGISLGHTLRQRFSDMGLVYLSSCEDPRLLGGKVTLPRGAAFITKDRLRDIHELADAITTSTSHTNGSSRIVAPAKMDLTDHQIDVLRRLASGATNAQIGVDLDVSAKAVEQSISRIAKRLGVNDGGAGNLRVRLATEYVRMTTK
jgi:two-component system, NarL family, nitrate/nitrite response regulator NarL